MGVLAFISYLMLNKLKSDDNKSGRINSIDLEPVVEYYITIDPMLQLASQGTEADIESLCRN